MRTREGGQGEAVWLNCEGIIGIVCVNFEDMW